MLKSLSIRSLLFVTLLFSTNAAFAQFADVQKDSLTYLYRHKIIDGYSDGTFKPDNTINRAELLKIVLDASKVKITPAVDNCFSDVSKDQWYAPYVCTAKTNGWIQGYGDGTFRPDRNINKVEALKIIGAVKQWDFTYISQLPYYPEFSDVTKSAWYYPYVRFASSEGYIDFTAKYYPGMDITRADVAEILFRTILHERIGDKPIAGLPLLARNFFKIEMAALQQTFDGFNAEDMKTGSDGSIYLVKQFQVSDLEWQDFFHNGKGEVRQILLAAKFSSTHKLQKFNWYVFYEPQPTILKFNIESQNNDDLTIGMNYGISPEKKEITLDDLRE